VAAAEELVRLGGRLPPTRLGTPAFHGLSAINGKAVAQIMRLIGRVGAAPRDSLDLEVGTCTPCMATIRRSTAPSASAAGRRRSPAWRSEPSRAGEAGSDPAA